MPAARRAGSLLPASPLTVVPVLQPRGLRGRPLTLCICSVVPYFPSACRKRNSGTEGADVPGPWAVGLLDTQAPALTAPAHGLLLKVPSLVGAALLLDVFLGTGR